MARPEPKRRPASPRAVLPGRVYAAVLAAALFSLAGVIHFNRFEDAYQQQFHDPYMVAAQFPRFESLREAVPENATLGCVSDLRENSPAYQAMYNSERYVLAPRLVRPNANSARVLGNFARPADFAAFGRSQGLRLERDFGNGVVLFRREGAR